MIYPEDFEKKIGFDSIRTGLLEKCAGRLGKDEVLGMAFSSDFNVIHHRLDCVREMVEIIERNLPYPSPSPHDVLPYLTEIKAQGSFMAAERLYRLMTVLVSFSEINSFFSSQKEGEEMKPLFPALTQEVEAMMSFPLLVSTISSAVNKFGEVKDSASPELYSIRESIRRAAGSMQRAMRRVVDAAVARGIVDKDVSPSIRDGRMVLPVAAGSKREISGIVHDESATGKTVFIEPAEVVEAGNRLRELEIEEKREIVQILTRIADVIRPHIEDVTKCCLLLGHLDFIEAKARFSIEVGGAMPNIGKNPEIEWYHAVHPGLLLSLRQHGREAVPLNITLSDEKRILIISGPNAGGKSVCLKTVAVVQYMMQCGMLPTLYYNSHMGVFRNIFIDIGDEQSFENDLSTYSSHLRNMRFFLRNADRRSLILADEMGSGTEPQIGGAMAQAILSQLGKSGCMGVVTTHFQNLKTFAESTLGFVNGAMLYDRQHLQPTFQLSIGTPGSSFALDIAHKMGLPREVIEEAKEIVGSEYVNIDKYLSDIARDRRYWSGKRQNIREKEAKLDGILSRYEELAGDLRAQRKAIIDDARKEAKEILEGVNAKIERTILEIRNVQAEKEKTKELRRELKDFANETVNAEETAQEDARLRKLKNKRKKPNPAPKKTEEIVAEKGVPAVGDYVKLSGGSSVGKVLSVSGKKAEVVFGALRTTTDLAKLKKVKKPKESLQSGLSSFSSATSEESRQRQLNFSTEIDVRGMRADEAIQAVTYFLDDAVQFCAGRVRILHGTGHGILKTLIRQQLQANTAVKSFADEDVRFGGAGITVVELE